ncbi:MAG: hypothetical protein LBC95_01100 [Candidatus Nomurabacteria bacterium]|jgi:mannose-6-phosphate isomerase-like protein (cupin superfamily)|nr:hypothetical protein [Candidatus Nomurabacteria bacterium]
MKHKLPDTPTFTQKGLTGYQFPTVGDGVEIYYVDSPVGHDRYSTDGCDNYYYIISGSGKFSIDGKIVDVVAGDLVEVSNGVEMTYKGNMRILLIMVPGHDAKNHISGRPTDI